MVCHKFVFLYSSASLFGQSGTIKINTIVYDKTNATNRTRKCCFHLAVQNCLIEDFQQSYYKLKMFRNGFSSQTIIYKNQQDGSESSKPIGPLHCRHAGAKQKKTCSHSLHKNGVNS